MQESLIVEERGRSGDSEADMTVEEWSESGNIAASEDGGVGP